MCSKQHAVLTTTTTTYQPYCYVPPLPTNHSTQKPQTKNLKTMRIIDVFCTKKIIILASTTTTAITTTIMHKMLAKELAIEAWSLFKIEFL